MTEREISEAWEDATDPRLELTREHSLSRLMMAAALREASLRDLRTCGPSPPHSSFTLSTTDGVSLEAGLQMDGSSPGGGGPGGGQVWSLSQLYSVDFSQSRIGVKNAFSLNAQSRFASVVVDADLGLSRLAWHT